ncbi:MAG: conjugal transfer protein TraR [Halobacteriovoraceae bacterium]|jgi:DnaK suppressor protein|nr:conjugal transfer protein TraR [Halobacteriovoraceae bacterium]
MSLSKKNLKILTTKIQTERERILQGLGEIKAESYFLSDGDRLDEVDQATSEYERSQMLRFRNRNHFYKKKLDKTLAKISEGDYGTCEECDSDIKFERLFARPTAELCISCKDEAEREEKSSFIGSQSKSMSKRVSLVG